MVGLKQERRVSNSWLLLIVALFFQGCESQTPLVNVYKQEIVKTPLRCLTLVVVPKDTQIEQTLKEIYPFKRECPYRLEVSFKGGIHCNSTQNATRSALGNFPQSYLRMEIRKGFSLQYSYYIDLTHPIGGADVAKGFERIQEDITLEP